MECFDHTKRGLKYRNTIPSRIKKKYLACKATRFESLEFDCTRSKNAGSLASEMLVAAGDAGGAGVAMSTRLR